MWLGVVRILDWTETGLKDLWAYPPVIARYVQSAVNISHSMISVLVLENLDVNQDAGTVVTKTIVFTTKHEAMLHEMPHMNALESGGQTIQIWCVKVLVFIANSIRGKLLSGRARTRKDSGLWFSNITEPSVPAVAPREICAWTISPGMASSIVKSYSATRRVALATGFGAGLSNKVSLPVTRSSADPVAVVSPTGRLAASIIERGDSR